ncbi:MAG: O-antigen ligase family protein [Planctomycetota bacterium]|nr:O-antigen ligase family protein [Planctomycetota bacterium]
MTLQGVNYHKLQSMALPVGMVSICSAVGLVATYVGLTQPIIGAGIAYVFGFLILAWYRPEIALMLCFAIAPLQNDLSGDRDTESHGKFSISEVNIMLTSLVFAAKCVQARRWPSMGALAIPMFLHFAVCTFSSIQHWRANTNVSMIQMVLYMVITLMLFKSMAKVGEDFHLALHGLAIVGVLLAIASLSQTASTIGLSKNGIGASIASSVVVGAELWSRSKSRRGRWLLGVAVLIMSAGLLQTLSRGAWLSTLTAIVTICLIRRDYRLLLRLLLLMGPLLAICWLALPDKSKEYATGFTSDHENIRARYVSMGYALDKFSQNPAYGLGVGLRKEYDATNIVFATLAETGVLGLATFLLIHVVLFVVMFRTQAQLSPSDPVYSLPALGAGLLFGKLINGMVDHYWSRGALTMAWAAAGMSLSAAHWVYLRNKQQRRAAVQKAAARSVAAQRNLVGGGAAQ